MSAAKPPELKTSENAPKAQQAREAMRRATAEATAGPREMRSGRFNPQPSKPVAAE